MLKKCVSKIAMLMVTLSVSGCHHLSLYWQEPQLSSSRKVVNHYVRVAPRYPARVVNHHVVYDSPPYVSHRVINHHVVYNSSPYMSHRIINHHVAYDSPYYVGPRFFHHERRVYRGALMSHSIIDSDD